MADKKNGPETAAGDATAAPGKINKNEAVRRAVATLGREVPHAKLQEYIMEKFGHDMTLKHISASLSTLSKKAKTADKEEPTPQPQAAPSADDSGEKLNKLEGVRRALDHLGRDAKAEQIQRYLMNTYSLDVTLGLITKYKSDLKNSSPKGKKGKKKKKKAAASREQPAAVSASPAPVGNGRKKGILLDDVMAVKALVQRVGPEQLQGLIDAFAK